MLKPHPSSVASFVVVSLFACGSPHTPDKSAAVISAPAASSTPKAEAPKSLPMRIPANAAFAMTVDTSFLGRDEIRTLLRGVAKSDSELRIFAAPFDEVGVDPSRPTVLAIASMSERERKAVDELRPLAKGFDPNAIDPTLWSKVVPVLERAGSFYATRLLIPASDATKLTASLADGLTRGTFRATGPGKFESKHEVVRVADDGKTVSVDRVGGFDQAKETSFDELDARIREGAGAPKLDGDVFHGVCVPKEAAYLGFGLGMVVTYGALSGESVDPAAKNRIGAEGFWESTQVFGLARYRSLDARVKYVGGKSSVTVRATPASGVEHLEFTPSIVAPGTWTAFDVARAFDEGWPLPGDGANEPHGFKDRLRNAGMPGYVVAAPDAILSKVHEMLGPHAWITANPSFDRVGILHSGEDLVLFGLLPSKATARDAEHARTAWKTPDMFKAEFAKAKTSKVVHAGDRYAVFFAEKPASIPKTFTLEPRAALEIGVPADKLLGTAGGELHVTVEKDGDALVWRAVTR